MKVAINCWALRNKQLDGIGFFTANTIARIIKAHPEVQFQILCDKSFSANYYDFANVSMHRIFPPRRHPILYMLYMELVLPLFLIRHKPDIFLSTDGLLSLVSRCRQIPVIHDLNFEHNPQDQKLQNRLYFRFFFKRFARKATRIATVSAYSKQDIVALYKIAPGKIDIIYSGINSDFNPLTKEEAGAVREKWTGGKPYFLFAGSMHPRKNVKRLIQAFTLFKRETGSDIKLLLVGGIMWNGSDIQEAHASSEFKDDIVFTGRISDADIQKIFGAAFALSFVPVFEGFGLPIVQAMQCNVPIICSNITAMPEIAGGAALLVDPFDLESISAGMEKMAADGDLRARLVGLGKEQRQKFSWDETARLLWQTVLKAVEQP